MSAEHSETMTSRERVLAASDVTEADKARLRQLYATLNPAALWRQIRTQQTAVWKLAREAETE
jgi:hypothetical protein